MPQATKQQIHQSRLLLQNPYAHLDAEGGYDATQPIHQLEDQAPLINLDEIRPPDLRGEWNSFEDIERTARLVLTKLWKERERIWTDDPPSDPVDVLDPEVALDLLGFDFERVPTVGWFETGTGMVEAAGFIDRNEMRAGISDRLPLTTQRFTAAHELGHALLHNASGLHRDRALSGAAVPGERERVEIEADKFATYFLMPAKLVRTEFQRRFLAEKFVVTDSTAFALISDTREALKKKCSSQRLLARMLADANRFSGVQFVSMAQRFSVSTETMAIRLEELRLL